MGPLKLLILMHFDAFLCNKNLHFMHFKCVSHTKKVQRSDFKSRSLTTLRTLPRTRKLTMFLAVFHFDLYFLYLHEDFVILYILLYVYYVVWVIQAVLEIFFRIRVLNEHQTGGCMTMRYPPPAPGRHHHTLYNNRY